MGVACVVHGDYYTQADMEVGALDILSVDNLSYCGKVTGQQSGKPGYLYLHP